MNTSFVTSPDGTRITYDVTGDGPTIMLLHGAGYSRQNWHDVGYVTRLKDHFKVITMDFRGHGESDKPNDPTCYTTDKMCQDILAVADACNAERFAIWGFSYGGNIGRYLAAQSDRITRLIVIGIPFGLGASGQFRRFITGFRDHWTPISQARREGTLDLASLSEEDREALQTADIEVDLAWLSAILDWKAIEPADLSCPTLWLAGSENENAMTSIREYEEALKASQVQVKIIEGLNHREEFSEIKAVFPKMLAFTQ